MGDLKYRVYDALLSDGSEKIRFCCSNVREISLRREIESGQFLVNEDSMELVFETLDRNAARNMSMAEF